MWRAAVFRSYYYLSDEEAIQRAKDSTMTDYQVTLLNMELFSRGCADLQYST